MASYTVLERRAGRDSDAEFVRDGFSAVAFLFPLPWMLFQRLWIESVVLVAVTLLLLGAGWLLGINENGALLLIALNFLVGLEASTLRLRALRRAGWTEWGVVEASDAREAETRYLAEAGHIDAEATGADVLPARFTQSPAAGPALGMLAYPGAR